MQRVGDNQLNIEHDMVKQRVSKAGSLIGAPSSEIIGKVIRIQIYFGEYLMISIHDRLLVINTFYTTECIESYTIPFLNFRFE